MKRARRIGACALGVLLAAGCGSGGAGRAASSGAALAMTLRWPARVAAPLPRNAQSVRVTLYRPGNRTDQEPELLAGPKVVNRPEKPDSGPATIVFDNLTPGSVEAHVTAHGQRDAADNPCASGVGSGLIELGKRNGIFVEMRSHSYRLEIQPASITLAPGTRQTLAVKAFDSSNTPILGLGFVWMSVDPGIAEVDSVTGVVKAVAPGTTQIVVQEEYNIQNAAATVVVQ